MTRAFAITLLTLALCQARGAQTIDYIAAIVNDSIITYREVEEYTSQALELLRRTYYNQPELFKEKAFQAMQDGLEQLIEKQLILDEFKSLGGRLPDTIIEDEIRDRIRQRFNDRATLTRTLKAQGITLETFRKRVHDEIVLEFMRRKNVSSALIISPQKIEQHYNTNLAEFQMSDQVKLRMIVLNKPASGAPEEARKMGQEIIKKLEEGATFGEMASIYSERREGRDGEWIETNRLNRGLTDIAFNLKAGERSPLLGLAREGSDSYWIYAYDSQGGELVRAKKYSDKGELLEERKPETLAAAGNGNGGEPAALAPAQQFYLLQVEEKRPARTRSLVEVREEIERTLTAQERTRLHKKWIGRLREKAFVRYFGT